MIKDYADFGLDKMAMRNATLNIEVGWPQLPDEGILGNARQGECRRAKARFAIADPTVVGGHA